MILKTSSGSAQFVYAFLSGTMCLKLNTIYRIKQYYRNKKQTFSWEQKEIIDMFMIFENIYNTGFPVQVFCKSFTCLYIRVCIN